MSRKRIKGIKARKPRKPMRATMNQVLLKKLNKERAKKKVDLMASIPRKILRSNDRVLISYYARSRGISTGRVKGAMSEFEKAARAKRAAAQKGER
jgi:hypothetical protein